MTMPFDFIFWSLLSALFDDFHIGALLVLILEGKMTKTKSVILQSKESSDQKIEENRPILKFNFTLKNMCDKRFWAI